MLLAIESSCDETSAAIVHEGEVRANVVTSQAALHAKYGGVVPELASREHLRNLQPVAQEALDRAGVNAGQLGAVAATQGPGLPSALLVGLKAAQALAFVLRKPFIGIHHHEAHLYSPWIAGDPPRAEFAIFRPNVSLIVSGGHTLLVHVKGLLDHSVLGGTVDDAAGECFDKTAKLIGLSYPGGPEMDRLAEGGDPGAFAFPRPMLSEAHDDFSFSGLKTSVRYFLRDHPEVLEDRARLADLCASVQAALVEVLATRTVRAAGRMHLDTVTASGGVTRNRSLRRKLSEACARQSISLRLAEPAFCTDNAGMVGVLAELKLNRGWPATPLDDEIEPGWPLRA